MGIYPFGDVAIRAYRIGASDISQTTVLGNNDFGRICATLVGHVHIDFWWFIFPWVSPFGDGSLEPHDVSAITLGIYSTYGCYFSVLCYIDFRICFLLLSGAFIPCSGIDFSDSGPHYCIDFTDSGPYYYYRLWATVYSFGYADDMRHIIYLTLWCWLSLWRFYYWLMIMLSSSILCGIHCSSLWRSTLPYMLPHYYYLSVYLPDLFS